MPVLPLPTIGAGSGWRAAPRLLHGSFRTLVVGQCLGQGADGLAQIAFAQFIVFEAGRGATPARIASLLAVTLLPFSLVGPFAGVVIDRWRRRTVLVLVSWLRAVLTVGAAVTVLTRSEAGAFVSVLLLLSTSRFVLAAKGASIPRTVPSGDLVTAMATSSVAGMTATFVGAVGGAAFVGRSAIAGFALAGLCYLAAGIVFARLGDIGGGDGGRLLHRLREVLADVRGGIRAVGIPDLGRPLSAVWLHRLLLGAGFVLLVLVADSRFHLRVSGYGLALAVTGVAAFIGTMAAPVCARRWPSKALLPVTFLPPAAAAYAGGIAPNLVVLVGGLAVTSLSFQLLKVLVDAMVGGTAPDEVRGRVFSIYDVLYNVAFVLAGLLMIPLWQPGQARALLWWLAAAFLGGWVVYARLFHVWPFGATSPLPRAARPWGGRAAALVLGALPAPAFPAVAWWWLAWVALVPLLLHLRASPTPREAAIRGWWAGAGYIAATAYWLTPVLGPALVLVAFGLGALWLPWGWAARRLLGSPRPATLLGAAVVLPSGWVLIEAVRSWQSLGGPWALLGATQWNQPVLLASAAVGGVWLTGFLVVAVNVALAGLLVASGIRVRAMLAGVVVAALAAGPAWAAVRPTPPVTGVVRVAVVQLALSGVGSPASRLAKGIRLTDALPAGKPDLVLWGESSVGYDLQRRPDLVRRLVALTRRTGADLLVNVDARRAGGGIYKTSVLVTPHGPAAGYVKTRLVPFGEYIPLRRALGWITHISKAAQQDRGRGVGPVVLHSGGVSFGPLICFESTFPDMARTEVALGADLIVYQTADTTFQGTWEQPQHASLAAVRAVETGRPAIQVALTGTTAGFDATGHRLLWVPAGRNGAVMRPVALTAGLTPFDVAGNWLLAVAVALVATALVVGSLTSASRPAQATARPRGRPAAPAPLP